VSSFNMVFFRRLDEETRNVIAKSYAGEVVDRVKGGSSSRRDATVSIESSKWIHIASVSHIST
jgi:hypothetical protein